MIEYSYQIWPLSAKLADGKAIRLGKSGDLPPAPDCAPLWHEALLDRMPRLELILLVGSYAQNYYLGKTRETLTQRVQRFHEFGPRFFPLPHPSPRNTLWLRRNPWFEAEVVPALRERTGRILHT